VRHKLGDAVAPRGFLSSAIIGRAMLPMRRSAQTMEHQPLSEFEWVTEEESLPYHHGFSALTYFGADGVRIKN
jgi:hypothetical protein